MSQSLPSSVLPIVPLFPSSLSNTPSSNNQAGPSRPTSRRPEVLLIKGRDRFQQAKAQRSGTSNIQGQNHSSGTTNATVMLNEPKYRKLQLVKCKWHKCNAELASVSLALKHYRLHFEKSDQGGLCGVSRCPFRLNTISWQEIHDHCVAAHIHVLEPEPGDKRRSTKPKPPKPPPQSAPQLPHTVPAYLVSCPSVWKPALELPPIENTMIVSRSRSRSKSRDPAKRHLDLKLVLADWGDAELWPTQGEPIAETTRHSSYIFPHPAAYSNNPAERALIARLRDAASTVDVGSSDDTIFPFAELTRREEAGLIDVEELPPPATAATPQIRTVVRAKVPLTITPKRLSGSRPMTVPLADVYGREAKRTKRLSREEKGKHRAAGERPIELRGDRRRKAVGPSRARRAADRVASGAVGRTIGVDWWETMLEVEMALDAAMAEKSEVPASLADRDATE